LINDYPKEEQMNTIAQVLGSRPGTIVSIAPNDTVQEALKRMAAYEVGALLVLDEGKLVGVVSERDYARKVALEGKSADTTRINEIMTKKLICAKLRMSQRAAMVLMAKKNIRHLPVLDDSKECVGIVSISDVVQDLEDEDEE